MLLYIPVITKNDETILRKKNTKTTAKVIVSNLKGLDVCDVLVNLFINVEDEISKELVKLYESQIILAVADESKFISTLNTFYIKTAKFIKKNNAYNSFLLFLYNIYKQKFRTHENKKDKIQIAYMSLALEQLNYLATYKEHFIGVSTKNKPLYIKEPYLYLDYAILKLEKKEIKTKKECYDLVNKLGYSVKSYEEFEGLFMNYRLIKNMFSYMGFLIDEHNIDILATDYSKLIYGIKTPVIEELFDLDSLIMNRRRLLKNNRITVELQYGEIKKIDMREKFVNDELFLILKFTLTNNTEFNGFYDIMNGLFYTPLSESSNSQIVPISKSLEMLVKELYLIQTADLDIIQTHYNEFEIKFIHHINDSDNEGNKTRNYNKNGEYIEEIINLSAYTRRLPEGAKASDSAIEEAKKFGINLDENETFVKPFQKNIYKLKTDKGYAQKKRANKS